MRGMGQADPLQAKPIADVPRSPPPSGRRPELEATKQQFSTEQATSADKIIRPIYIKASNNVRLDSKGAPSLTCHEYLECSLGAGFNRAVMPLLLPGGSSGSKLRYVTSLDIGSSLSLQRTILFVDASIMPQPNLANSLRQSFQVAAHIGPDIVMLQPSYDEQNLPQMVSAISNYLQDNKSAFLWILVPFSAESKLFRKRGFRNSGENDRKHTRAHELDDSNAAGDAKSPKKFFSHKAEPFVETWTFWKRLQTACDYISNLNVCLLVEKQHIYAPKTKKSVDALDNACFFDEERCEAEHCINRWLGDSCDTVMVHATDIEKRDRRGSSENSVFSNKTKQIWSRDDDYMRVLQKLTGGSGHVVVNFDPIESRADIVCETGSPPSKMLPDTQTVNLASEYSAVFMLTRELYDDSARFPLSFPRDPPGYQVGYENEVQIPLQPMADNLADQVYEVFEVDPVKYEKYQQAIAMAMDQMKSRDRLSAAGTVRVLVAGAGRGPLVDRTIQAAIHTAGIKRLYITIIEKNLGAYYTLQRRLATDWLRENILEQSRQLALRKTKPFSSAAGLEDVKFLLLNIDMRKFRLESGADGDADENSKLDIIVSELLGSFACNELAPECLRGLERFLQPNGVMIPQEYSALVRPVMANKLWKLLYRDNNAQLNSKLDCMCIVRLHRYFMLTDSSATAFNYEHPVAAGSGARPGQLGEEGDVDVAIEADVVLDFEALCDAELDGFAGSFNCLLYQKRLEDLSDGDDDDGHNGIFAETSVVLSTVPEHATENLISWFPAFMPLRQPVLVKTGDLIRLHIERKRGPGRVWYSWCLLSPCVMPMQNVGGKVCHVGLYT